MKKSFILLVALFVINISCKKDEEPQALPFEEQLAIDLKIIDDYIIDNSITDVLEACNEIIPAGDPCEGYISYVLHEEGTGLTPPNLNTKILVSYTGRLMSNDEQFDANDTIVFNRLSGLILGWQAVLLDMQEGDSVTMYIPSGFAYGFGGTSTIPSNANLIFDMKLHQVD